MRRTQGSRDCTSILNSSLLYVHFTPPNIKKAPKQLDSLVLVPESLKHQCRITGAAERRRHPRASLLCHFIGAYAVLYILLFLFFTFSVSLWLNGSL
ncbi:hypothetical protein FKM82_024072 [Ascaphus truei]